jgi:16S rRNA (uracil1498-N3)-methyltransferase
MNTNSLPSEPDLPHATALNEPRLFLDVPMIEGAEIPGTAAQAHYLGTVMRRVAGDPVRTFNGRDGEFVAVIAAVRRDRISFRLGARLRPQASDTDLWLMFSLLKRDATDLVVQKATELGAAALLPVFTDRTNAVRVNEGRLAAIATEAAEQSERLTIPVIHPPRRLHDALAQWPAERRLHVAMERSGAPMLASADGPAGLLVGPEGGFTPVELEVLRRCPFVNPATLGPRILRAETACLAGLALLQAPGCG